MRLHPTLVVATVICSLGLPLAVQAAPVGAITASGAWSRPVAPGLSMGVVYMTVHNSGRTEDRLLGASTPLAASASLHQSMTMGGMASMQPVTGGLVLPPGGAVTLAPGGYHLMLEGLKHGLKAGARYPLTLRFAKAAPVTIDVEVRPTPQP